MIIKLALAGLTGYAIYKGVQAFGAPRAYAGSGPNELTGNLPVGGHVAMRGNPPAEIESVAPGAKPADRIPPT